MLTFSDCDLVLLNYNRPSCTQQAIDYNENLPWKRIIVADQQRRGPAANEKQLTANDERVVRWVPEHTTGSLARLIGPAMAESSFVCTHDDEYLVTEDGWLNLFDHWNDQQIIAYEPDPEFSASSWLADLSPCPLELEHAIRNTDLGYGAIYRNEWPIWCHEIMSEAGYGEQCLESSDKAWTTFWGATKRVQISGVRRLLMPSQEHGDRLQISYADNTPQATECKNIRVAQQAAIMAGIKARYDLFKSRMPAAHWFRTELHG